MSKFQGSSLDSDWSCPVSHFQSRLQRWKAPDLCLPSGSSSHCLQWRILPPSRNGGLRKGTFISSPACHVLPSKRIKLWGVWCKLWVLLTFLASWASPFSFLLSKMLVRKWVRKVSPLSSLDLGARLPGIMTSSMFLFAAEFIKTDLWGRWAGEFLSSCSASQQLHCTSALS